MIEFCFPDKKKSEKEFFELKREFDALQETLAPELKQRLAPLIESLNGCRSSQREKQLRTLLYEGKKLLLLDDQLSDQRAHIRQSIKKIERDLFEKHGMAPDRQLEEKPLWHYWGLGKALEELKEREEFSEGVEAAQKEIAQLKQDKFQALAQCRSDEERVKVRASFNLKLSKRKMRCILNLLQRDAALDEGVKEELKSAFFCSLKTYRSLFQGRGLAPEQYHNLYIEADQKIDWRGELAKLEGGKPPQSLLKKEVEAYIDWMRAQRAHRSAEPLSWAIGRLCAMLGDQKLLKRYRSQVLQAQLRSDLRHVWNLDGEVKLPARFLVLANLLSHPPKGELGAFIKKRGGFPGYKDACAELNCDKQLARLEALREVRNSLSEDQIAKSKLAHRSLAKVGEAALDGKHWDKQAQSASLLGKMGNWLKRTWKTRKLRGAERVLNALIALPTALAVASVVAAGVGLSVAGVALGAIAFNPVGLLALIGIASLVCSGVGIVLGVNYIASRFIYKKTGKAPWKKPDDFVKEHKKAFKKAREILVEDFTKGGFLPLIRFKKEEWDRLSEEEKAKIGACAKRKAEKAAKSLRDLREEGMTAQELLVASIEKVESCLCKQSGPLQWKTSRLLYKELQAQLEEIGKREWQSEGELSDEGFDKEYSEWLQEELKKHFEKREAKEIARLLQRELDAWYAPWAPKERGKGFLTRQAEDLSSACDQADLDPADGLSLFVKVLSNPIVNEIVLHS